MFTNLNIKNSSSITTSFLIKVGLGFIAAGILTLLLQEAIILILASIFIAIGLLLFTIAYKIWTSTKGRDSY